MAVAAFVSIFIAVLILLSSSTLFVRVLVSIQVFIISFDSLLLVCTDVCTIILLV